MIFDMKINMLLCSAAAFVLCAGCVQKTAPEVTPEDKWSFDEDEVTLLEFTKAEAQYVGDDVYAGVSDHWIVELSNEQGDTLGLELNSKYNPAQTADFSYLYGTYHAPQNNGDFSEGTYCYGDPYSLDAPGKVVTIPLGTYYQYHGESGETLVDYLFMGMANLSQDGIKGTLVGEDFLKRVFTFTGSVRTVPVRYRGYPNTNLTSDVILEDMSLLKIRDLGNYFYVKDEYNSDVTTYRYFEILFSSGDVRRDIDLTTAKYVLSGTGQYLKIGLLVNYDATISSIPEGEYTMAQTNEYGGVPREDIVPFRFQAGVPDVFGKQSGSWYVDVRDGEWSRYGRIAGGTIRVSVENGSTVLTFNLTDCGEKPKNIKGSIKI